MAVIAKQRYKLDIAPKGGWVIVYASQHDDGAREIEFEITNQGNAFSIPALLNVSVQGIKSNGSYFSHSCSYSGNVVTMALADDMTDIIGKAICVLKFTNSSQQKLATAKFVLNVDTDSSSEGIVIDTDAEEIFNQMLNEIRAQAASVSADIAELQSMVGSPLVASTASTMTDHNKIYVYTGSESGYTNGNWYYWNGSAWTSGGVYNSTAFETDKTLSVENMAADANVVGNEIDGIKKDVSHAFGTSVNLFNGSLVQGMVNSSGVISNSASAFAYSTKIPVTGGETVVAVLTYGELYPRYGFWAQFKSDGSLLLRGQGTGTNINAKTHQYYAWITTSAECAYIQPYFMASGSNPLNPADYENPKLYSGIAPNDLVNVVPLYMHSENVHLLTTTANDICGNDLNNLPNNRHFAINITDGSIAHAPITQMTGRILTYGKDVTRSVGDMHIFYHTSGSVYFRIYWSGGFKPWVLLNDNGLPQLKILACGDSICRGARNSYKGFVGDLGLDYKNIGVGDATISNINTSVTNIPDALIAETAYTPDVIVADGGINDYHYEAPLGTIPTAPATTDAEANTLDRSTVMGGAGYLFYQMIKKFPNAQRFFIITHKTQWNTGSAKDGYCPTRQNTQGYTQKDLHDALVAICNVYGVNVIDVYNDSLINSAFSQYRSPTAWNTDSTAAEQYMVDADGVHPTANGYINGYVPLVRQAIGIGTVK